MKGAGRPMKMTVEVAMTYSFCSLCPAFSAERMTAELKIGRDKQIRAMYMCPNETVMKTETIVFAEGPTLHVQESSRGRI